MVKTKIKIREGNNEIEKEYDIPVIMKDADVETSIKLLTIIARAERDMAQELGLDIEKLRDEQIRVQLTKEEKLENKYRSSSDYKTWDVLTAKKINFEIVCYILQKADDSLTRSQISSIGNIGIANIMLQIFPEEKEKDFTMATTEEKTTVVAKSSLQKKN